MDYAEERAAWWRTINERDRILTEDTDKLAEAVRRGILAAQADEQPHEMNLNVNQPRQTPIAEAIVLRLQILGSLNAAGHSECAHKVCAALQRDYPEYFGNA